MLLIVFCSKDPSRHGRTLRSLAAAREFAGRAEVVAPAFDDFSPSVGLQRLRAWRALRLLGPAQWSLRRVLTRLGFTVAALFPQWLRAPLFIVLSRKLMGMPDEMASRASCSTVALIEEVLLAPAVFSALPSSRKVLDMRDYYPRQFEHSRTWRILVAPGLKAVLDEFLPQVDAVVTVSDELAGLIRDDFGVSATVVRNIPEDLGEGPRTTGYVPPDVLRLVHHGAVGANRRTTDLVTVAEELGPRASVSLYLVGSLGAVRRIRRRADNVGNCTVFRPVPYREIIPMLANFDIGLLHLPPTTTNLRVALPNKLFECLHAGLPVVVGPDTTMARFVIENECGWVAPSHDPKDFASTIAGLTSDDILRCRSRVIRTVDAMPWSSEEERLKSVLFTHRNPWPKAAGPSGRT